MRIAGLIIPFSQYGNHEFSKPKTLRRSQGR